MKQNIDVPNLEEPVNEIFKALAHEFEIVEQAVEAELEKHINDKLQK